MLKGKRGIIVLIPLNILIWSFFLYRFLSFYNEDSDIEIQKENTLDFKSNLSDSNTYSLLLNYSDPFLKNYTPKRLNSNFENNKKERAVENKINPPHKEPKNELPNLMPEVKYLGLVKNSNTGSLTAIVSINGNSKLIKQNEVVDGIVFSGITNNNLVIQWNKERIIINK